MKALVVYDSVYGNTEKIAKAIAGAITASDYVKVLKVNEVDPSELEFVDLLIVGSPTHGGRATPAINKMLKEVSRNSLKNTSVAAFDTRISGKDRGAGIRLLTGVLGYAAGRIAGDLKKKGGKLLAEPEGFIVEDNEGPLRDGELERAAGWAKGINSAG